MHSQSFKYIFANFIIFITLASTCTRILGMILFTCDVLYGQRPQLSQVFYTHIDTYHRSIFVSSYFSYHQTHMRYFLRVSSFIYTFDHNKYIQFHIFNFLRNTHSTKRIINCTQLPPHLSTITINEQFFRIQIHKGWSRLKY